jgi:hypothetical protein
MRAMTKSDAYRMITRRAPQANIVTKIRNHSLRTTGITEYLRNGGRDELANKWRITSRPTGLYESKGRRGVAR